MTLPGSTQHQVLGALGAIARNWPQLYWIAEVPMRGGRPELIVRCYHRPTMRTGGYGFTLLELEAMRYPLEMMMRALDDLAGRVMRS